MKTPVIVPAYNEANYLGKVLTRLPADRVEPIVANNGSTDATGRIAELFGARVITMPEQGKLPAVQHSLKQLGKRALGPVLILDGDTYPLFPAAWHDTMREQLIGMFADTKRPVTTGGLVWYTEANVLHSFLKLASATKKATKVHRVPNMRYSGVYGPNMGIHLRSNDTLDAVLDLPHYWPGEDIAIANTAISRGGVHKAIVGIRALAVSPMSVSAVSLLDYLRGGAKKSCEDGVADYISRGAAGSQPYITS